ncbi:hypothetical protein CBS63078_10779 [Aspergillus niger]|uniref:Uncharacterized protein n=2 Tax=Aspergillus niger TaxID=5061 RepID=G3XXZ7_ASPNA|nr:hypothetical protein ASPNIDRAFT_40528 [Aspergillus niger ATCC 1015]KAI2887100.1 hypothetical protein CBS63078_10779 [Aspergillus niger]KAI3027179.1 hypothetical protein CBS147345_2412 [Aspergillus niger]TPR03041.1 CNH domain family protein [Aspergillus niger]SPB45402.1 unnamed protein product [Aspergillus niger]
MSGRRPPNQRRIPFGAHKQITAPENDLKEWPQNDDNIAQQLTEAQHKVLELDRENKQLTSQVHDLNQVLVEREQAFAQSEQELRRTQRDLKAVEIQIKKNEEHVQAAESANTMLNAKNNAQAEQIRRIRQDYKKLKEEETSRSGEIEKLQQQILDASRELNEIKQKLDLKESELAAQKLEMGQLAKTVNRYKGNDTELRKQLNRLAEQVHKIEPAMALDTVAQPTSAMNTALIPSAQNKLITHNPFGFSLQNPSLTLRQELGGSLYSGSQSAASSGALSPVDQRGSISSKFSAPVIPAQNQKPSIEAVPVDWSNIQQAAKTGAIPHVGQALVPSTSLKRPFAGLEALQGFDGSEEAIKKLRVAADQQKLGSNPDNSFLAVFQKYLQTLQEATNQNHSQQEQLDVFKRTVQALTAQGNTSFGNQFSNSQSSWIQDYQKAAAQAANDPSKAQPKAIVTGVKQPKGSKPKEKPKKFLTRTPNYQWPVYLEKRYNPSTPLTVPPFRTTRKKFANFSVPGAYEDDQTESTGSESKLEFETAPEYFETQVSAPEQVPMPPAVIMARWALVLLGVFIVVTAMVENLFGRTNETQDIWMQYNEVPEGVLAKVRGSKPPVVGSMQGLDYEFAKFVDIRSRLVG